MSQIATFYLIKITSGRNWAATAPARSIWPSGTGVRANWIWMSVFRSQTEDTLDCALLAESWRLNCWQLSGSRSSLELAAEIAPDWDLPTEAVQSGLETLRSHLELVRATLPCCMK